MRIGESCWARRTSAINRWAELRAVNVGLDQTNRSDHAEARQSQQGHHIPPAPSLAKLIDVIQRIVEAGKIYKRHHINFLGGWVFDNSIDAYASHVSYRTTSFLGDLNEPQLDTIFRKIWR